MQRAETVLGIIEQHAQSLDYTFKRLYRNLYNPDFYFRTADQLHLAITADEIDAAVRELRNQRLPQGNKLIKIIESMVCELLTAVYKPFFEKKLDLGSSLYRLKTEFKDVNWVISGSLESGFRELDMKSFQAGFQDRIDDNRLIELIYRLVKDRVRAPLYWTALEIDLNQVDQWFEGQDSCYVRFGAEIAVGIKDLSREAAEGFWEGLSTYISGKLGCSFSSQEFLLTSWTNSAHFNFFGYEISLSDHNIRVKVPTQVINDRLKPFRSGTKAVHRGYLMNLDAAEIIRVYSKEIRSLYNRYCYADNIAYQLRKFHYYHRQSLVKTLAAKLKLSAAQVVKRYSLDGTIGVWDDGKAVKYCDFSFARKRLTGEPYAGKPARTVRRGKLK